jgi:TM2 domain-containing membrane protein YozV
LKPSFNKTDYINSKQKQKRGHKTNNSKAASEPIKNNSSQDDNQIISGYFLNEKPYKELIIQRVNNFLYCVLGILVIFCFIGYYFVSCKEVQLNQISRETLELNYENDELQNKLDSLQSYYNIDKAVSKANILERARQVVEVDAIDLPNLNLNSSKSKSKHSLVVSY